MPPPAPNVYCADCRWLICEPATCIHISNIGERVVENWIEERTISILIQTPMEKNQDNDCPDYEKK
jgi:hypothetical protein